MFGGIGPTEIIIVLVVALLVLGPKRLPETGKSLGRGLREFKDSLSGRDDHKDDELLVAPAEARSADTAA